MYLKIKMFINVLVFLPVALVHAEADISQMAAERFARDMMDNIKKVQKLVGKPVDEKLALQIALCSDAAAHKADPGKINKGVEFDKVDASRAIDYCSTAYNNGGDNIGLVLVGLSRAYNKAEKYDVSLRYARQAVEVGYPFGSMMMAFHYQYGDGVEKNPNELFRWSKKAAAKGVPLAMRMTADYYLDGAGTSMNVEEAYFWALSAVEKNDPKAFYQLGKTLVRKAQSHPKPETWLLLARRCFEIADNNAQDADSDIDAVNTALRPNHIASDDVLFAKTIKGTMAGGVFSPVEKNSNWYLGEKPLSRQGNTYFYGRTSYNSTVFTLWYKQGMNDAKSGWFIDFLYSGSNSIKSFDGVSVLKTIDGSVNYINLDISDAKVEENLGTYRLTAGIDFRDVLLLQNGELVKFYYTNTQNGTPTYTMNLNEGESLVGDDNSANAVIGRLSRQVIDAAPGCCRKPAILPLSEQYLALSSLCESSKDFLSPVQQDCHDILKSAQQNTDMFANPYSFYIKSLLHDIEKQMSDR